MSDQFLHNLHLLALLSLLAAQCSARPAAAQEVQPVRLTDLGGFVELMAENKVEKRSRPGAETSFESDQVKLQEVLHVDLRGDVYHPRFLKYSGGIEIQGLQRPRNEGDDRFVSGATDRLLMGGEGTVSFLERHPYGLILRGKARESEVEQTFARSYDLTSELYGATFFLRKGPLPLRLSYDHRSRQGSGAGAQVDEVGQDLSGNAGYQLGDSSRGDLEYHLTDERILKRDLLRQEFLVSNTTSLDDKGRKKLRGRFRFFEQSDILDTRTATVFGTLDWRHTETLSAQYRFDFQRNDAEVQLTNNWNAGVLLSHQLFESLRTVADIYGRLDDDSFGERKTYGLILTEDYTKRLGGWGRLGIGVSPSAELIERRPRQETAVVFNEAHTLETGTAVGLGQRRVDPATIVVTDETGSTLYVENEDYIVTQRGAVTELTRLATGNIDEGETVLVDYSYSLAEAGDVLTSGVTVRADVSFLDVATVFGRVESSNQSVAGGNIDTPLESRDRQGAGIRVTRSWMSARAAYERVRSTFTSYDELSESLSLFTPGTRRWRGRVSGSHSYLEYADSDESVRRMGVAAALRATLARRTSLEIEGSYQRDKWAGDPTFSRNDVDAFGVKAELTWRYRKSQVRVGGRLSRVDRYDQQEDSGRFFLRLRREF